MTDFFELDGGSVPFESAGPLGPGSTVPLDSPSLGGDGGIVQFTSGEWKNRQAVAESAAEELSRIRDAVNSVAVRNSFGELVEGEMMHSRVVAALANWRAELDSQVEHLDMTAAKCRAAFVELSGADADGAKGVSA